MGVNEDDGVVCLQVLFEEVEDAGGFSHAGFAQEVEVAAAIFFWDSEGIF